MEITFDGTTLNVLLLSNDDAQCSARTRVAADRLVEVLGKDGEFFGGAPYPAKEECSVEISREDAELIVIRINEMLGSERVMPRPGRMVRSAGIKIKDAFEAEPEDEGVAESD